MCVAVVVEHLLYYDFKVDSCFKSYCPFLNLLRIPNVDIYEHNPDIYLFIYFQNIKK